MKNCLVSTTLIFVGLLFTTSLSAQSPGLIVRPAGGTGVTLLNPDGNAYSSSGTVGFVNNDIAESEIPFRVVPVAVTEPTGDVATGPSAGFTDIVTTVDGSGFYLYKSATHLYFRLRIGNIISGSKGYSVLIDTDNKMGSSGPFADPNFVAPSGKSPGNPGFEYEVVLQTNFQVAVFNLDGTATPGTPVSFPLNTHSQISVAKTTDNNNADYFYDWVIPVTAIGSPAAIRTAVTTVTSPNSAFQGSRSDIYGIDDAAVSGSGSGWELVVKAQSPVNLVSFNTIAPICTAPPLIGTTVTAGSNVAVNGTWTRLDPSKPSTATISLYKNRVQIGSVNVSSGTGWNILVSTLAAGDTLYATAVANGESECLHSNYAVVKGCSTPPPMPVITCASTKGISGTMAAGSTIAVYLIPTTSSSVTSNLVSNTTNLTYPTSTSFALMSNGCTGSPVLATGTYMIIANNGCNSEARFECITSGSSSTVGLTTNAITINTPLYPFHTNIAGSGATLNDLLRLFVNGKNVSTIIATSTTFNFTGLNLAVNDKVQIFQQPATGCMTQSASFTVNCFREPPQIISGNSGNLLAGATLITGTSGIAGAVAQLYKGAVGSGVAVGSPVITTSNGSWSVPTSALVSGEIYYATINANGCTSAASAAVTVATPAPCPAISGSYTDMSTTITGTLPASFTGTIRLYNDGVLIGSQAVTAATVWNISPAANTLYYNGRLQATAQATGGAESGGCSLSTIGCSSPLAPAITPLSSTIDAGNNVTFSVNNVSAGSWYALSDASGAAFATSQYRSSTGAFSLPSNIFSTPGTYNLKLTADALSGCPASFTTTAIIVKALLLPVKFVYVNAVQKDNSTQITWRVASEAGVHHYTVEKSTDGTEFKKIDNVVAKDTPVYTYNDILNTGVHLFYRIRAVDNDGKSILSKTIRLQIHPVVRLSVYPNPATAFVKIAFHATNPGSGLLTLTDSQGRRVISKAVSWAKGDNLLTLETSSASRGLYIVQLAGVGKNLNTSISIQ